MIDKIIENYINHLSIDNILLFAAKNNINLDNNEANIIYNLLINNWYTLLHKDPSNIFNELNNKVSIKTYNKCIELYNIYYKKYKNYL